jgi:hypothetical protein
MPLISPTRAMERWTVRVDGTEAVFSCAPLVEDHTAARALPRVWAGRGLGVPDVDVPGLVAALSEVMKTPAYWRVPPAGQSPPRHSPGVVAAAAGPRRRLHLPERAMRPRHRRRRLPASPRSRHVRRLPAEAMNAADHHLHDIPDHD